MTLGEAVQSVRKSLGQNQEEFALLLGVQRNTVSRYELGQVKPSPLILLKLFDLARHGPKEALRDEIQLQLGTAIVGKETKLDAPINEIRSWVELFQTSTDWMQSLPAGKRNRKFAAFASAASWVLHASKTVDDSITEILGLWSMYSGTKLALRHFRDAAAYLRVQLSSVPVHRDIETLQDDQQESTLSPKPADPGSE